MIYAVIPLLGDDTKLQEKLNTLGVPVYDDEAPKVYFVKYNKTTSSLADAIGYKEDGIGTGIILQISNYSGYANKDLWAWIRTNLI